MKNIIDIHTHKPTPYPCGLVNAPLNDFKPADNQFYSAGIHPWDNDNFDLLFPTLQSLAEDCRILAIGEAGIDLLRGGAMFQQLLNFRAQVELSEKVGKPLIIHCVKADDVILGLHRDLKPQQPWVIHGFRGKPAAAQMFNRAGIYLSYGERFNPQSLLVTAAELMLAETDESSLSINEIITSLSAALCKDISAQLQQNTHRFLSVHV